MLFLSLDKIRARLYRYFYAHRTLVICISITLCATLYIGHLFIGSYSIQGLLDLYMQKRQLSKQISDVESDNAKLQKDIFSLRELKH